MINYIKITLLSLSIFYSVANISAQNEIVDQVIAVVGKNIILQSDIENRYMQMKSQGYISGGDLKCDVLEDFLYEKLLLNQAELDSIEITQNEIDYAMDNRFRQIVSQLGSEEELEKQFGKSILEMKSDMKDDMKKVLLSQKMLGKINEDMKITPTEVRKYYNDLPKDSLPTVNESFEIEQIIKYPLIKSEDKKAVKEKLNGYRDRILAGDKFSTLAVMYSEDPGSAPKGGEIGYITRTQVEPEFAAVAFNLKDPKDVSRIVETNYGYHIIQLIDKKGELINVRHILLSPKVSPDEMIKAKKALDSISVIISKDTLSFAKAAAKFSDDEDSKNTGGLIVNPYTGSSKFEKEHLDASTYYSIKNLNTGELSKPFETKNDDGKPVYKIVRLKSKTKAHVINLKEDYQTIKEIALADKKQKALSRWISQRQASTYIHIDDSYIKCNFKMKGWVK